MAHNAELEHDRDHGWRAACSCGYAGPWRTTRGFPCYDYAVHALSQVT